MVAIVLPHAVGQGFTLTGEPPSDIDDPIVGPNGVYEFEEGFREAPRCLAHEMSVGNQGVHFSGSGVHFSGSGVHFSGSAGGLIIGPTVTARDQYGDLLYEVPAKEPAHSLGRYSNFLNTQTFGELMGGPQTTARSVVILVVDDFAGGNFAVPYQQLSPTMQVEQLAGLIESGEFSHGALVVAHLTSLIEATGMFRDASGDAQRTTWTAVNDDSISLTVVAVDVSVADSAGARSPTTTDAITDVLGQAILDEVDGLDEGRSLSIVVNMSWVLLPCPTVADFLDSSIHFQSYEAYVAGLEIGGSTATSPEELERRLSLLGWVPSSDSLIHFVEDIVTGNSSVGERLLGAEADIVFVAAAGNFSMNYQMLPAALPSVLGVGTPRSGQPPPEFSNVSDVAAPGAWFHLNGLVSYAGTSYSAPFVSLVAASDLMGTRACVPTGASGQRPGFALQKSQPGFYPARVLLGDAAALCGLP